MVLKQDMVPMVGKSALVKERSWKNVFCHKTLFY